MTNHSGDEPVTRTAVSTEQSGKAEQLMQDALTGPDRPETEEEREHLHGEEVHHLVPKR